MSNKYVFGKRSIFNQKTNSGNNSFYFGKVESNSDEHDSGSIKVRIKNIDDHITETKDLPNCFPMLQKFFHVIPKVGETVLVFIPDTTNEYIDRVYIGPIISQPQFLEYDSYFYTSRSSFDTGFVEPQMAPSTLPETNGVYPKKNEIAIQGRGNSDIILKKDEIVIRSGKFLTNDKKIKKFNDKYPAYIQLKTDINFKDEKKGTVTNIVASKINLLTHDEGNPRFVLNNREHLIDDDEMLKILENAHPLVFGDLLIEYLKLQRKAFINHVHPYHGKKPQDLSGSEDIDEYLKFDLNKLISKNVRTN